MNSVGLVMNNNLTYFRLQLKKILYFLPKLIIATIVLATLAGAIAFYGTKLLYNQKSAEKITIAVVVEDESPLMDFGMNYLESSESVNSFCRLVRASYDEAVEMIEDHSAIAYIHFPETFTDDIVSGINTPAKIIFSKQIGIEQLLFQELTAAASKILTYAQASIYSFSDVYSDYDFIGKRSKHYDVLNENTLTSSMIRAKLFQTELISSTDNLSIQEFYTVSGVILLLFLMGMSLGKFAHPETGSLARLLSLRSITASHRTLWKLLTLFFFYTVIGGLIFLAGGLISLWSWKIFLFLPVLALLTASWTLLLYTLTANETTGTLLMFFGTLLCAFCSGCLIPSSFLPEAVEVLGHLLPTYHAHQLLCSLYVDSVTWKDFVPALLWIGLFFTASCFIAHRTERRISYDT